MQFERLGGFRGGIGEGDDIAIALEPDAEHILNAGCVIDNEHMRRRALAFAPLPSLRVHASQSIVDADYRRTYIKTRQADRSVRTSRPRKNSASAAL